ncbi:MAG: M14 family zinc carboxypeptidase, partial [Kangiellaceae bacterium]
MKTVIVASLTLLLAFFSLNSSAKSDGRVALNYYLPLADAANNSYKPEVPTPESQLGYQVGEWHVRPEQLDSYFRQLAAISPRVTIETYAHSYEKRPLSLVFISSEENIKNLESLRQQHLKMEKSTDRPAVTWMGYSVHGNEASGSNASLLLGYHLAAATDQQTLEQLKDQIIIIDPSLNPDGLSRFAHWANSYRSKHPNSDSQTREHNEAWPYGRTNHYWF